MKYLSIAKNILTAILVCLAGVTVWSIISFVFGGSWTAWGLGKLFGVFWAMLKYVFMSTVFFLVPPIAVYILLVAMLKNPILRIASGIGCTYLFWIAFGGSALFSWGSLTTPIDTVLKIIRLSLQVYFLVILVMPPELMSILGTIAAVIGSIVIYFFPDAPGALDDIAAVCTLISMVFVYLNTLAMFIKQHAGGAVDFVKRLIPSHEKVVQHKPERKTSGDLVKEGMAMLECGDFGRAEKVFEQAQEIDSKSAGAYVGALMAEQKAKNMTELAQCPIMLENDELFKEALRLASPKMKQTLEKCIEINRHKR